MARKSDPNEKTLVPCSVNPAPMQERGYPTRMEEPLSFRLRTTRPPCWSRPWWPKAFWALMLVKAMVAEGMLGLHVARVLEILRVDLRVLQGVATLQPDLEGHGA